MVVRKKQLYIPCRSSKSTSLVRIQQILLPEKRSLTTFSSLLFMQIIQDQPQDDLHHFLLPDYFDLQQPPFRKQSSEYNQNFPFYPELSEKSNVSRYSTKSQRLILKSIKKIKVDLKNPETKNITKFFGSRLALFIQNLLSQQLVIDLKNVDPKRDLELLKSFNCSTIKGLSQLWMSSSNIRSISENYFKSVEPIIEIMSSSRISNHAVALKFIPSYLKGITHPNKFRKLNWSL